MFIQMPIHGLKEEVKMEIRVQSLKFDADQKLLEFVEKKVSKIGRFDDAITDVTLKGAGLYPVFVDRTVKSELGQVEGITGRKSPHVLRHTLATELLDDGSDIYSIKELLGHSSLAATQVYTHNTIEKLKNVYSNAHPRAKRGGKNGD